MANFGFHCKTYYKSFAYFHPDIQSTKFWDMKIPQFSSNSKNAIESGKFICWVWKG